VLDESGTARDGTRRGTPDAAPGASVATAPRGYASTADGPRTTVRSTASSDGSTDRGDDGGRRTAGRRERGAATDERRDATWSRARAPEGASGAGVDLDVDRFVDRLYRGLERKVRVERERRGL
jgi:hypothetical protein